MMPVSSVFVFSSSCNCVDRGCVVDQTGNQCMFGRGEFLRMQQHHKKFHLYRLIHKYIGLRHFSSNNKSLGSRSDHCSADCRPLPGFIDVDDPYLVIWRIVQSDSVKLDGKTACNAYLA